MKILDSFNPETYDANIKKLDKSNVFPPKIYDLNSFIINQPTTKLRLWIRVSEYTIADNISHIEESFLLLTIIIKIFTMELEVNHLCLSNKEILKLLKRFLYAIKYEFAYRNNITRKHRTYTILKDVNYN